MTAIPVRAWFDLPCGCNATRDGIIVHATCFVHLHLVAEAGGSFDNDGWYGPVDVPEAVSA